MMKGIKRSVNENPDCSEGNGYLHEEAATAIRRKIISTLGKRHSHQGLKATETSFLVSSKNSATKDPDVKSFVQHLATNHRIFLPNDDAQSRNKLTADSKKISKDKTDSLIELPKTISEEKLTKTLLPSESKIMLTSNTSSKHSQNFTSANDTLNLINDTEVKTIANGNYSDKAFGSNKGLKRTVLKRPNLKSLRNSPLWSLSKLIDDVSTITEANKRLKNNTSEKTPENIQEKLLHKKVTTGKLTLENDEKKSMTKNNTTLGGLKPTLNSAIDKIQKLVAHKEKKTENSTKDVDGKQSTDLIPANDTTKEKGPTSKKPLDPYAEIASGPDRPKLPELKTDDEAKSAAVAADKTTTTASDEKETPAQLLSGQHDVGGLLDSLTDKLNAAGKP